MFLNLYRKNIHQLIILKAILKVIIFGNLTFFQLLHQIDTNNAKLVK